MTDHGAGDSRPLVSVVIPAYNEADRIADTISEVTDELESLAEFRWEIVVVDDGSTDDTLEEAEAASAADPRIVVAPHPANFNLGQALRYGFSVAKGDYIVTLDADLSYSPDHIGRLLDALITTNSKVVIASPYRDGGSVTGVPALRLAASRWANRLLSSAAKGNLTTVTGMVRAYDGVFLRRLDLKAMDVEINAEIIYKAQLMRARITEIPAHLEWTRDDSSPRPFRPGRSISGFAFTSFLFRPYAFFLIPSAVLFVIALAGWVLVLAAPSNDAGTAVGAAAAATVTLTAVALSAAGVLSAQSKRYFEELFHLGTPQPARGAEDG